MGLYFFLGVAIITLIYAMNQELLELAGPDVKNNA